MNKARTVQFTSSKPDSRVSDSFLYTSSKPFPAISSVDRNSNEESTETATHNTYNAIQMVGLEKWNKLQFHWQDRLHDRIIENPDLEQHLYGFLDSNHDYYDNRSDCRRTRSNQDYFHLNQLFL